jgi:predicted nucleic-acid-binding protein
MVDTNVLLDWLLDRDSLRTKIIEDLFTNSSHLQVPDVILVELAFALEKIYKLPRLIVSENITKILDDALFSCSRNLFHNLLMDYVRHPALSFVDCYAMHYAAQQNALPVWTFDKSLVNQSQNRAQLVSRPTV